MGKSKPKRRKWDDRLRVVPLIQQKSIGTLADVTLVLAVASQTTDEDYRVLSTKCTWTARDLTAGEGPLDVGWCHSDYSQAEVEECIEATASWLRNDKVANEQANRLVRRVGSFSGVGTHEVLNDGKPIHTKLNWRIGEDQFLHYYVYNHSGAPMTTGAEIGIQGTALIQFD